jgi:hypothetical protein
MQNPNGIINRVIQGIYLQKYGIIYTIKVFEETF